VGILALALLYGQQFIVAHCTWEKGEKWMRPVIDETPASSRWRIATRYREERS
jgi:hypothetical protein